MKIQDIKWDSSIYPRGKWNSSTISRYADAMIAGDVFPGVIVEEKTHRLLDGKHRIEAYLKAAKIAKTIDGDNRLFDDIPAKLIAVPESMSVKYFAASLSSRHGDRLSNADLKELALSEFNPETHKEVDWKMPDAQTWGKGLSITKSTVYEWVSHFIKGVALVPPWLDARRYRREIGRGTYHYS